MKGDMKKQMLGAVLCLLSSVFLCSSSFAMYAFAKAKPSYRSLPFPEDMKRYETEFFRLIDPSYSLDPETKTRHYDPDLAAQFERVIRNFSSLDKRLRRKLLSGPAPKGEYIAIGDSQYFLYTLCQAHWCNVTNFAVLYQPKKQRMVGRLLYACSVHNFGNATSEELQVIDEIQPRSANEQDCELAKEQK